MTAVALAAPAPEDGLTLLDVLAEPSFAGPRRPQTLKIYRRALGRLAASGVRTTADARDLSKVRAALDARLVTVKPQTARVEAIALMAVLRHLERSDRFPEEGVKRARRLVPAAPGYRGELNADWLTHEEVEDLALAGRETSSLVELTIRLAALTGLRVGELARLRWADVDLEKRVLVVRGQTKTGRARAVPIVAPLLALLRNHPGARLTREQGQGLVLGCGRTVSAGVLARRVRRLGRRSGLRGTLMLLRHTRASWWVAAGVPIARVASWMGHGVDVCVGHYIGLTTGYDPAAEQGSAPPPAPGAS